MALEALPLETLSQHKEWVSPQDNSLWKTLEYCSELVEVPTWFLFRRKQRAVSVMLVQPKQALALEEPVLSLPRRTVFIFDWDDTLLATSCLEQRGYLNGSQDVSGFLEYQLQRLDEDVCRILQFAQNMGDLMVVTNAMRSWVSTSSKKFLPMTSNCIARQGISITSARDRYERYRPCNPISWKTCAFVEELEKLYASTENLNVVVIGDSDSDVVAAHDALDGCAGTDLKIVKFVETPTVAELIVQLRHLFENLEYLANLEDSCDVSLVDARRG